MARSIKKKAKTKARSKKILYIVLAIVVTGLAISWIVVERRNTQLHQEKQRQLATSLDQKGQVLDRIVLGIENSEVSGEVKRSSYCYKPGRKFQESPIYCMQALQINGENVSDRRILADLNGIASIVQDSSLGIRPAVFEAFDKGRLVERSEQAPRDTYVNCSAYFIGEGSQYRDDRHRNSYEVSIECLGADFDKNIYEFASSASRN